MSREHAARIGAILEAKLTEIVLRVLSDFDATVGRDVIVLALDAAMDAAAYARCGSRLTREAAAESILTDEKSVEYYAARVEALASEIIMGAIVAQQPGGKMGEA
jgi:hypothetical protein